MRNVNKNGVKWLFYPLFSQKLAEFVLFLKSIIYIYLNALEPKIFEYGGGTNGLMGGIKDFPRGGGAGFHGGDKGLMGGSPSPPPSPHIW